MSSLDSGDCETEEDSAPEACVSPGGSQGTSNSREMRNKAEKMRRDKLNSFISELAVLVPIISESPKRMDKTSILRLSATHLRIKQDITPESVTNLTIPDNIQPGDLDTLMFESLTGFLIILTNSGKIVFVSNTIEHILGHLQTDLMGQSIFNLTYHDDQDRLRDYLTTEYSAEPDWRKYFNIRLRRAGPRSESPVYEFVNLMGMQLRHAKSQSTQVRELQPVDHTLWILFARIERPEPIRLQLMEASKDEYITRHLVDGRIINCDQRISFIAGYMIQEVSGLSAFKFMHREDVRWVMIALRQMYDKGESRGTSCYRLLSKTGHFIYLRTFGFLEIDNTGTVESFICVNTLVPEREGLALIHQMKQRYSALIKSSSKIAITNGDCDTTSGSVEDPVQLEEAITHLITNLPSPESECSRSPTCQENQDYPSTPSTDYSSSSRKPAKSICIKVKTATKRPPSAESLPPACSNKRHRNESSPAVSPAPSYQGSEENETVVVNNNHR